MKTIKIFLWALITISFAMIACKKNKIAGPGLPNLTTMSAGKITAWSAESGGEVLNDGGSSVTQRGIVWGINPSPTKNDFFIQIGSGVGSFTGKLSGLKASTTYFVRAFATNAVGTAYGNEISFTTGVDKLSYPGEGVIFDSYNYKSIVLKNGQEWMAENLKTTIYANGDPIPNVKDSAQWIKLTSGAWTHYDNNSQYENPYGKLYNWYAVEDSRNVCPEGWHVPTKKEWLEFAKYLDPNADISYLKDNNVAGEKLKSSGTQYWKSPNNATNESDFTGLPGGSRPSVFNGVGSEAIWWSSSELLYSAYAYRTNYNVSWLYESWQDKENGLSVRCIKD